MAQSFGLPTHVLRHWEDMGLLRPARTATGYRQYSADDVARIATIVSSKASGMALEEIAALFDADVEGRKQMLERHLAALDEQERQLRLSRALTEHALECEQHQVANCPNFKRTIARFVTGRDSEAMQVFRRHWRNFAGATGHRCDQPAHLGDGGVGLA